MASMLFQRPGASRAATWADGDGAAAAAAAGSDHRVPASNNHYDQPYCSDQPYYSDQPDYSDPHQPQGQRQQQPRLQQLQQLHQQHYPGHQPHYHRAPTVHHDELGYSPRPHGSMSQYPPMSATFIPGSNDDFYMPTADPVLMAPAPQRHMPEVSDQIQSGIANLNMNGRDSTVSTASMMMSAPARFDWAFPKVQNALPNVPPTDDDVLTTLENARMPVLTSNDADMQLEWAADALRYARVSAEDEERLHTTQPPRPATPPTERQVKTDAMNVVTFLADQKHPKAEFLRGMWHEFGSFGVALDKKEAFRCYSRAADRGYARAEYRIGMLYETANNPMKALPHYLRGVDAGDSASMYRLGMMTLRGQHGQKQDFRVGIDLIRRAADCADENAPHGAYVYGMLLARELPQMSIPDDVLPYDESRARRYIEEAAYNKSKEALVKMGSAYELGALGCQFDPILSLHYNRLAAKQGEPEANMAISKWFLVGREPLFPKNEEISYTYANRAASLGLANAEFAMGYFNELGIFVQKNLDIALEWYNRAAANGNPDAADRIEGLSHKQVLSRKDHENVAIKRITSMYGSQHGGRPARFAKGHPPRGSSLSGQIIVESPPPHIVRSATTPYPEDDRPPTVPPGGGRSASVAPYPIDDTPSPYGGSQLHGGFLHIDPPRPSTVQPDRPSTAFTIDPTLRPNSTTTSTSNGHQALPPHMRPHARPAPGPNSSYGRPAQGRMASNPAAMPPRASSAAPVAPTPPPHSQSAPPIDIGFSAPPDERESRRRPQPGPPGRSMANSNKPLPAQAPPAVPKHANGSPSASTPRPTPQLHHTNTGPISSRPPPRTSSMSNLAQGSPASNGAVSSPSHAPQAAAPASSSASSTAKPPKKGPQTFEEMGVPSSKAKDGCVMM